MSLQSVEASANARDEAQQRLDQATEELKAECRAAVAGGVPIAKVARAAGVTRVTLYAWISEADDQ